MKKSAIYISVIVLILAVIGGLYWIFSANKNAPELVEIKSEELTKYLSYIPSDYSVEEKNNVYAQPKKASDFDKEVLLGVTVDYANRVANLAKHSASDMTTLTYDKDEIDALMLKLYNISSKDITRGEYACSKITVKDNLYEQSGGCGGGASEKLLGIIDKYEATKESLTIYEYKVYYKAHLGSSKDDAVSIRDMYTKKEVDLLNSCSDSKDYESYEKCAQNYFEDHSREFTKYKHTFKKGKDGYYWVETEKD